MQEYVLSNEIIDADEFDEITHFATQEPWSRDIKKMPGFGNMGNTCFANTVL